ncbi:MAG: hypothetical protein HN403_15980 [Rhodospirillales bacterium]|jgi:hypothetical protein|nr:hypothetical protein [Rhodospirillales bacterium]
MNKMRRIIAISLCSMLLTALRATAPGVVFAESASVRIPENATAKSYGGGWECNQGYREADGACVAIKVPENAHLDYSGNDWECNRPYRKRRDKCVRS